MAEQSSVVYVLTIGQELRPLGGVVLRRAAEHSLKVLIQLLGQTIGLGVGPRGEANRNPQESTESLPKVGNELEWARDERDHRLRKLLYCSGVQQPGPCNGLEILGARSVRESQTEQRTMTTSPGQSSAVWQTESDAKP